MGHNQKWVKVRQELIDPIGVPELRCIFGIIQYFGRFLPNLTNIIQTMPELLKWYGMDVEQTSEKIFSKIQAVVTYYHPSLFVTDNADAISLGPGATLYQEVKENL